MTKRSVAWLLLLASAVLEAVWATALGLSDGLTVPLPTAVFAVTTTLSMIGLGLAIRSIPLGTAYAVWVGIGAALTVGWAMATGVEPFSVLKVLFIGGIVGCAAGLKSLPADTTPAAGGSDADRTEADRSDADRSDAGIPA
ncbi:multidrug efflux SMR transporter [Pseudarthrobacter sp. BIM B-2242]|uniref:DMT family transporter n=1 Tax=Pseudarthrobacter sp. BIM B-2242 TaxID=2772401 RepID=UPI00168B3791|nr:multidrug efflux SMR transporter [Pseudarthrobacter sp. BIM B-2242]QOD03145.1 multidrug efflux SMR transporter [Pseudarthrobacter sp. BIM B-2242]